jgi:hypothetical protein
MSEFKSAGHVVRYIAGSLSLLAALFIVLVHALGALRGTGPPITHWEWLEVVIVLALVVIGIGVIATDRVLKILEKVAPWIKPGR